MVENEFLYKVVRTSEDLVGMVEDIRTPLNIAFDFETTGLDPFTDRIWGMSVATDTSDYAYYIPKTFLREALFWFTSIIKNPFTITWGFNLKFDWHFLDRAAGTPPIANPYDAMTLAWLIDEEGELGLKPLAARYLGETDLVEFKDLIALAKKKHGFKRLDQVRIEHIDQEVLEKYAAKDAWLTLRLAFLLTPKAKAITNPQNTPLQCASLYEEFVKWEAPFLGVIKEMESHGIYLDMEGLQEFSEQLTVRHTELLEKWNALTNSVNQSSPKQLVTWFYETLKLESGLKTKKGAPSVDVMAVQRMKVKDITGTAQLLLDIREVEKLLGTYVLKFLASRGILRGSFGQTGTVTGRLNSSDPNLQNIPSRGELGSQIKYFFVAPPGFVWITIDYSQIELRVLAHYAKAVSLLNAFINGEDPHQLTADMVAAARYIGKTLNFSWVYGAGARKLCDTVEKAGNPRPSEDDARHWLAKFSESYPELENFKRTVIRVATQRGYLITFLGRHRNLPDLRHFDNSIRSRAERQTINSLIQGGVGDLMKWAMVQLNPKLKELGAAMVVQVHDELGIVAPRDKATEVAEVARQTLESIHEAFGLVVPIIAEPSIADNWGEAKA